MVTRRLFRSVVAGGLAAVPGGVGAASAREVPSASDAGCSAVTLFLCGDVMTGRGIDQALPFRSRPQLYEPYVQSAGEYVALAEARNGPIERPIAFDDIWGDALALLDQARPERRIVNLETAVTTSDQPWLDKGIHYRMHPGNVACLTAAHIDCCVLANNHVLDWGRAGLAETLRVLQGKGLATAGAGLDAEQAAAPAVLPLPAGGRVLVFAFATESSGVPRDWRARAASSGVNLLPDLSLRQIDAISAQVASLWQSRDIVVASIHWGGNWGYRIGEDQRRFAHALIAAGIDLVHGHSSHHAKAIEVHRGRLILYGCGDLINDYEGIGGHESFRGDLSALYLPTLDATGLLQRLLLVPMQMHRFRLRHPSADDVRWLQQMLERECRAVGAGVVPHDKHRLALRWP